MDDAVLILRREHDVLVVGGYRGIAEALDDLPNVAEDYPDAEITAAPLIAPRAALLV
jgi:hypothetical protein